MARYLLVSDVYCPWCHAFAPVLRELLRRRPLPVRVYPGELVDEPTTVGGLLLEHPSLEAGIRRIAATTGRAFGDAWFALLRSGSPMVMDSRAMAAPLAALRRLAPGREPEQMEALQAAYYLDGLDVSDPAVQAAAAGVDAALLAAETAREETAAEGRAGIARALGLLGDFVVYPTLFLEAADGSTTLLSRGYSPLGQVLERLAEAERAMGPAADAGSRLLPEGGCGPGGCALPEGGRHRSA